MSLNAIVAGQRSLEAPGNTGISSSRSSLPPRSPGNASLKKIVDNLKRENEVLEAQLNKFDEIIYKMETEIANKENENGRLFDKNKALCHKIEQLSQRVSLLQQENSNLKADIKSLKVSNRYFKDEANRLEALICQYKERITTLLIGKTIKV